MTAPVRSSLRPVTLLPDLAAFLIGLAAARQFGWQTTDLVWSLWFSSLAVGYLTLILIISRIPAEIAYAVFFRREIIQRPGILLAGSLVMWLFMLTFFSFHFCAFHAGHAAMLSAFFPVDGLDGRIFFDAFMNPPRLIGIAYATFTDRYALFLLAILIGEHRHLIALITPEKQMPGIDRSHPRKPAANTPFLRPYINVIRMHLLLFFFAAAHALHIDHAAVYAVVYAVYFFPWALLRRTPQLPPSENPTQTQ